MGFVIVQQANKFNMFRWYSICFMSFISSRNSSTCSSVAPSSIAKRKSLLHYTLSNNFTAKATPFLPCNWSWIIREHSKQNGDEQSIFLANVSVWLLCHWWSALQRHPSKENWRQRFEYKSSLWCFWDGSLEKKVLLNCMKCLTCHSVCQYKRGMVMTRC